MATPSRIASKVAKSQRSLCLIIAFCFILLLIITASAGHDRVRTEALTNKLGATYNEIWGGADVEPSTEPEAKENAEAEAAAAPAQPEADVVYDVDQELATGVPTLEGAQTAKAEKAEKAPEEPEEALKEEEPVYETEDLAGGAEKATEKAADKIEVKLKEKTGAKVQSEKAESTGVPAEIASADVEAAE